MKFKIKVINPTIGEKIKFTIDAKLMSKYENCERMRSKQINVNVIKQQNQPHSLPKEFVLHSLFHTLQFTYSNPNILVLFFQALENNFYYHMFHNKYHPNK